MDIALKLYLNVVADYQHEQKVYTTAMLKPITNYFLLTKYPFKDK